MAELTKIEMNLSVYCIHDLKQSEGQKKILERRDVRFFKC